MWHRKWLAFSLVFGLFLSPCSLWSESVSLPLSVYEEIVAAIEAATARLEVSNATIAVLSERLEVSNETIAGLSTRLDVSNKLIKKQSTVLKVLWTACAALVTMKVIDVVTD